MSENEIILEVKNLQTYFHTPRGVVRAVDGVSFNATSGKTMCIVGESGCGKSITSMSIMRLLSHPGKIEGGEILYDNKDLAKIDAKDMLSIRGNDIAMIFQEPMTSLNPVFKIGDQIAESLMLHKQMTKVEAYNKAVEILEMVRIPRAKEVINEYPHQLSGGMRQRVMIAIALCCDPKILIADEPTTALDVTIQAQILELMNDLKKNFNTAIIFITHDLGVVAEMADDVTVMYAGRVIEQTSCLELFANPKHPYTIGLLKSKPSLNEERERLDTIEGSVPNPAFLPEGCYFAPRCKYATEKCRKEYPDTRDLGDGHLVSCFYAFGEV
ncbi:MAG: ABC transporter ATP-binding protein [Lachnospirales bacterium]